MKNVLIDESEAAIHWLEGEHGNQEMVLAVLPKGEMLSLLQGRLKELQRVPAALSNGKLIISRIRLGE